MKVAIIGGGIAGLTCAYRLAQKGIKSIVFEKGVVLGGRLQWSGVVGGVSLHPYSHALVKELGLEEVKIPLLLRDLGAVQPDGSLMKMEDFPKLMQSLPPEAASYMQKLGEFIAKQSFDVKNPSKGIVNLRNISFEEYMKDCPEMLKSMLGLEVNIRLVKSWKEISAEYGLICIVPFFTTIPKEEAYTFEENMVIVTNVLGEKIEEAGSDIRTDATVKRVEKTDTGFKIYFGREEKAEKEEVDKLILAVPLIEAEKIFPELDLKSGVKYSNGKCVLVRGELKPEYDRKALFVFPGHRSNLSLIFTMVPEEHRAYLLDPTKAIDLGTIYKEFEILGERELVPAWPIIPPKALIPELKTNMEGVYLCGDFYHFVSHDTSVATAEMVVEMITGDKKIKRSN